LPVAEAPGFCGRDRHRGFRRRLPGILPKSHALVSTADKYSQAVGGRLAQQLGRSGVRRFPCHGLIADAGQRGNALAQQLVCVVAQRAGKGDARDVGVLAEASDPAHSFAGGGLGVDFSFAGEAQIGVGKSLGKADGSGDQIKSWLEGGSVSA
jgi:hypothetical protein